ncbi:MAG TPA: FAD/NAD(P)-binding protein [Atribacter sp.]|uniref:Anaerobic sulfite reductase subunit B n=1 Tax=Candidatus Atribacter allofermentans TaxID=1852833 RepID=A0A1V5SK28_9BACT|nr:FAD/NAD(P)-binding protein [Atribacter sp.]MDD3714199.1 FAD/NAD(P)-binding protein [Atribacterota bacterium]OQA54916.1 MAG: Anaerobic sulfite reductase subunit B [Candidatus Atribacteria bacterium ADurb.Bin276]MDI9594726.1 FAD/NAD(P)-binding protein [Atribacterota bacterium]HOT04700.1 FAD/NAD(P)-binding protein [Atribacter sp.]HQK83608.1 FAD/NAD(P)-binding protein [Atribacter sp.]
MAIDLENKNIYLPRLYQIMEIIPETSDIKTFRLDLEGENSSHLPGQFAELFVPGVGEAPISITSSPTQKGILEFSIKRTGLVTSAIHRLNPNDRLGIRGPYGNTFPLSDLTGQNLLFIAGGIGLAPLRSLINYVLDTEKRNHFKKVTILYGARSPQDLVFKWELKKWQNREDITFLLTVDRGDDQWKGTVGLVPNVLKENVQVNPLEWKSIICGPPIMIKFTIKALLEMGFQPPDIITTLEMRMKCGLGKCGRCNIGPYYVCKDGPVFTYQQLQNMPEEY